MSTHASDPDKMDDVDSKITANVSRLQRRFE